MKDDDISRLFSHAPELPDAEVFQASVMTGLRVKLWLKQGLVVLAGIIGGVYALAQFIRLPQEIVHSQTDDITAIDGGAGWASGGLDVLSYWAPLLNYMQAPGYFWFSFAVCTGFVALYYIWSRGETL